MAEPLLGRPTLVADHLPGSDLVTVSSTSAGPAGSVGLVLGEGVEIDVDAAPPHRFVGLSIDLPSGDRARPLPVGVRHGLDVLLGPDCFADLVAFLGASGRDGTRPTSAPLGAGARVGTAASPDAALTDPLGAGASPVAPAIHRAAIAHGIACAPGTAPLVRAVALLEAAVGLAAVGRVLDVDGVVRGDVQIGVELLLDVVARGIDAMPGGRAGREVAGLLRRVSELGGVQSLATVRLRTLARELERAGPHRPGTPGLATADNAGVRAGVRSQRVGDARTGPRRSHRHPASVHAGRPGMPGRVPLDIATLPGSLAEAPLAASRIGPAEVEVRIDGWAERRGGLWARALLAGGGSLLAVAPFRADAGSATARLLVPPNAIGHLEVDVTDQPELPRPSPALAAVQRAIHLGRAAAQAQRVGDPTTASLRWRQCARHWARAGDDERAEVAHALGAEAARSLRSPGRRRAQRAVAPLVADLVAAEG